MNLNDKELIEKEKWEKAGINLFNFDRPAMRKATKEEPTWIHFGAGNIFRAFPAALQQKLLNESLDTKGIIAVDGYDGEIIERMYRPHDELSLLVTLKANGTIEKTVIGSIAESLILDSENEKEFSRLKEIFRSKSLQMVSFTITEKGYNLVNGHGTILPDVESDFEKGPQVAKSYIGKLTALCFERYMNGGAQPLALVSMDNCSHNGSKLFDAVHAFALKWTENGFTDSGFKAYIENPKKVSFPWSMIDKITPRPDDSVKKMLSEVGFEDTESIVTSKNTYVSPFVNSEEAQYLVIEDLFPNGRPPLDKAGVIFTNRETVDKVEKMKVCTCLNPLHTTLAVFGCLLGYTKISEEMNDKELSELVKVIGYKEGLPVVVDPGIISPKAFIDEVLNVRIPNPFMPDTPQRIACDTSQKLSIRFGETIKAYIANDNLNVKDLKMIPLVLAGWCRYLLGVNDEGERFDVSPDPMYDVLEEKLAGVELGQKGPFHDALKPILSDKKIFAVDLYEAGLGEIVEADFTQMMAGPGAVRATLKRHLLNDK